LNRRSNRRTSLDARIKQRLYLSTQLMKYHVNLSKSVSNKTDLFEKTNPILKMQNAHNTLHSKKLQQRDIPPPPKNKPDQNQILRSNPCESRDLAVIRDHPLISVPCLMSPDLWKFSLRPHSLSLSDLRLKSA
jgi:hypothetical protein